MLIFTESSYMGWHLKNRTAKSKFIRFISISNYYEGYYYAILKISRFLLLPAHRPPFNCMPFYPLAQLLMSMPFRLDVRSSVQPYSCVSTLKRSCVNICVRSLCGPFFFCLITCFCIYPLLSQTNSYRNLNLGINNHI